jgi:hypothetical protein
VSNLSDLLPAGASAKQLTFTDSGSGITSKKPVVLESDGDVTEVSSTAISASITAQGAFNSQNTNVWIDSCYDSNSNRLVIVYVALHPSGYNALYAILGTIASNGTISYGTAALVYGNSSSQVSSCATCFDSTNNKVIIGYTRAFGYQGLALVGTVSGDSISFGSETQFETGNINETIRMAFDSVNGKTVICYRDAGDSNKPKAVVGTTSGTSISFGSEVIIQNTSIQATLGIGYDSNLGKIVAAYRDSSNSNYGTCAVGTVSGTSISFGTQVVFESVNIQEVVPKIPFDSKNNKLVFVYIYSDVDGYAKVGTVSGTSISFGSNAEFENANIEFVAAAYNPDSEKVNIFYMDQGNSNYGTYVLGTVSGSSISFNTPAVFRSAHISRNATTFTTEGRSANSYVDHGNSFYGSNLIYQDAYTSTNLTATNFVGIADSAISASAAGSVIVQGGTVAGLSSLTAGSKYYVQIDGTFGTTAADPSVSAGLAISTTSLLLNGDS